MRISFLLILCVLLSTIAFGQESGNLRGVVSDSTNGEVLAYGNVYIKEVNRGSSTDERGYFYIASLPANRSYTVIFSYVGYLPKELDVFIAPNKITEVEVELSPESVELQTIEKIGEKVVEQNATDIGLERISIKKLESLPKSVEVDVFRSLQSLPGVQSTGDVSARYYVRGGASNQNLVLLDGITVYNPFHALGLFSVIDPEIINSVEFYKGGFPAEYGGRLSSVLSIVSKDGNKNRFSTVASSSYLTGKALFEGPIPDGSFYISGRKSYNTKIYRKFINKSAPFDFYDLSFKLNYQNSDFIEGSKFMINGFFSADRMLEDDPFKEDFEWKNNLFGFSWFQVYDSPLFSELSISVSNFTGEVIPKFSTARPKKNEINDITFNSNFTYIFDNRDEIGVGIEIQTIDTKLLLENTNGVVTDLHTNGAKIGLFAKYKFLQYENFGMDVGTRATLAGLSSSGSFFFEPRISTTYRFSPMLAVKAAWGVYQQEITTISNENEVISLFEPYIISPEYLTPARSTHYIFGVDTNPLENLSFDTEVYYKKYDHLPSLNENKKFEDDPDLIAGEGESYGMEFMMKYGVWILNLTGSYSLSWSYIEADNWLYYPRYDSRHTLNFTLEVNIGKGWTASGMWIYNTGRPFTPLIGFYDKLYVGDIHENPYLYENYFPYSILGDKNIERLPDYHRLDFNLSKKFDFNFMKVSLDFSILNVYDRKNIFYFKRDTGERVDMLPFLPTATLKVEI
ncbi:MAG: TonB-dependent receptor [Melioribacteraceae bacterium]|nr:TonB-dependent receptor [Melioribacteraceae bacterium]MCF8356665.1 TonB-dependent receptor [Melioribacteraceae bacterium]MCF8396289.1 TonB-dependent receptor [Melioribacteraceae bacterium]MCF8419874.1 TonB-dependent receptor [Melioribacteraceae bacterium]